MISKILLAAMLVFTISCAKDDESDPSTGGSSTTSNAMTNGTASVYESADALTNLAPAPALVAALQSKAITVAASAPNF